MEKQIVTKRIAVEVVACAVCGRIEPGIIHSAESFPVSGFPPIEGADLICRSRGYPPGWEICLIGYGDGENYSFACPDCLPRFREAIDEALARARHKLER